MDIEIIIEKIEVMRKKLNSEYEKCIDCKVPNPKVLTLSEELDKLIVEYMRNTSSRLP